MNESQIFNFLQKIGISLNREKNGKYRWSTKPLTAATPAYRFPSLRKVMDFWRARCQSTLYEIYEIEESIRLLGLHHPDMTEALFLALRQENPYSYDDALDEIQSNLPKRPTPTLWQKNIINEVEQLGPIHAQGELWRATYFRALSRLGYHQHSHAQEREDCNDESQDR
ncbi:hypothetical protein FHT15_003402 [Xanthomonas campestris]